MGYKVIGLDIADQALEEAKNCGADHTFNSMTDNDWKKKVLEITGGGVDAAVNFTASKKSYDDAPDIIRPGLGLLMVVGIPRQPLTLNALDIALGRYRVKGSNNGSKLDVRSALSKLTK
jgi:propanol-preferring alcohol dehydrogenase